MQNVFHQKQIQLKSSVGLVMHSCLTFMNSKDTLINTSCRLCLILPPSSPCLPHQGCSSPGLFCWSKRSASWWNSPARRRSGQSEGLAAGEHQPPRMGYALCKPAPRLEVTSSMTWIFLCVQLHPSKREVFSICLTSLLKYQAVLQSQPKLWGLWLSRKIFWGKRSL